MASLYPHTMTSDLTDRIDVITSGHCDLARYRAGALARNLRWSIEDVQRVEAAAVALAKDLLHRADAGLLLMQRIEGLATGIELIAISAPNASLGASEGTPRSSFDISSRLDHGQLDCQIYDRYTDERGSATLARCYPSAGGAAADVAIGVVHRPIVGERVCGDSWRVSWTPTSVNAVIIDGLGHGVLAREAAEAGASAFDQQPDTSPASLVAAAHARMRRTRGGAIAAARYDLAQDQIDFMGVGDISAAVVVGDNSRSILTDPGIVGQQYRLARHQVLSGVQGGLLVLHSDGLQSRWQLNNYPGLATKHPALIAAILYRDFDRRRDDTTILVVNLSGAC